MLAGAKVIAPVRNEAGKAALLEELGDLNGLGSLLEILVLGDYATADGITQLAETIKTSSPEINHVVSCFGGRFKQGTTSTLVCMKLWRGRCLICSL